MLECVICIYYVFWHIIFKERGNVCMILIILMLIIMFVLWCFLRMASIADKDIIEDLEEIKK